MANPIYREVFPFLDISEDEFIVLNDNIDCASIGTSSDDGKYDKCDDLNLNTFTYTDYKDNDYEGNIDPVNNFYKNNQHDCQYFSIDKFNETFNQDHGLYIIHFNCRSPPHNFDKVKETLRWKNVTSLHVKPYFSIRGCIIQYFFYHMHIALNYKT